MNAAEKAWCRDYLLERGQIGLSPEAHYIVMQEGNQAPSWIVGFDDWMGQTCHIYVASNARTPIPRQMADVVFDYGFNKIKRERMFAVLNSLNVRSMRLCRWLGFREVYRAPHCHVDNGDIVLLEIMPVDWASRNLLHGQKRRASTH